MAEKEWLTVSEVTEKIGVPVETVRRYIRTHGVHLKVKRINKRYQIHNDAVTVLKQIRELYDDDLTAEEIEQTLTNRGVAMTVTVQTDDDKPVTVNVGEELQRMNERLNEQTEFNKLLLQKLEDQQRYIKESIEKRDQLLLEELKTRQETAATEKKGFWVRLFNK